MFGSQAFAWNNHKGLTTLIFESVTNGETPTTRRIKKKVFLNLKSPCPEDDSKFFSELVPELQLQKNTLVLPTNAEACARKSTVTFKDIITSFVVDEPDSGIDDDLDESFDPNNQRKFMGGSKGATSRGFRHMYFEGWKIRRPISTFQIPLGQTGEAPNRVELLAKAGKDLLWKSKAHTDWKTAWGVRLLGWSIHYVQDLAQPFHSDQVPSLKMVPWYSIVKWPPSKGFEKLVKRTTQSLANYHWAVEEYMDFRIRDEKRIFPLKDCLLNPEKTATLHFEKLENLEPKEIALTVAAESSRLSASFGKATFNFFGSHLRNSEYDLPKKIGQPNYAELALRPDLSEARTEFEKLNCTALSNAAIATIALINWALKP